MSETALGTVELDGEAADALAAELKISKRTVYRDIAKSRS
jgi:predicted DNA-binding transcriptional regulator YafY